MRKSFAALVLFASTAYAGPINPLTGQCVTQLPGGRLELEYGWHVEIIVWNDKTTKPCEPSSPSARPTLGPVLVEFLPTGAERLTLFDCGFEAGDNQVDIRGRNAAGEFFHFDDFHVFKEVDGSCSGGIRGLSTTTTRLGGGDTPVQSEVPEPAALWLVGGGLVILRALRR